MPKLLYFAAALALLASCKPTTTPDQTANTNNTTTSAPATPSPTKATPDGTYKNAEGQTLTIKNYQAPKGFDFAVEWGENDEWGCKFSWDGTATTQSPTYAYQGDANDPEMSFNMAENSITITAGPTVVGMDCMKYGDSQSERFTVFKK